MLTFNSDRAQDNYLPQLNMLQEIGDNVEVRGRYTKELLNVATEVHEPQHHCILIPERHWNPWLALSEFLWIMAGREDIATLVKYNRNITEFSDDGTHLYGAYGRRMRYQIDPLISRLQKDPTDRRAVISIWEPRDLTAVTKDPPCNNLVYFKLRQGELDMTVINRSNDLHWGLYAANVPTFGLLQEYIASRLGVGLGTQTHLSNSLHLYVDDPRARAITERMLGAKPLNYPKHRMAFEPGELMHCDKHVYFGDACDDALGHRGHGLTRFLEFASAFLDMYEKRDWKPHWLDSAFADWIAAGNLFVESVWNRQTVKS